MSSGLIDLSRSARLVMKSTVSLVAAWHRASIVKHINELLSVSGHKQTSFTKHAMSAMGSIADISCLVVVDFDFPD